MQLANRQTSIEAPPPAQPAVRTVHSAGRANPSIIDDCHGHHLSLPVTSVTAAAAAAASAVWEDAVRIMSVRLSRPAPLQLRVFRRKRPYLKVQHSSSSRTVSEIKLTQIKSAFAKFLSSLLTDFLNVIYSIRQPITNMY